MLSNTTCNMQIPIIPDLSLWTKSFHTLFYAFCHLLDNLDNGYKQRKGEREKEKLTVSRFYCSKGLGTTLEFALLCEGMAGRRTAFRNLIRVVWT